MKLRVLLASVLPMLLLVGGFALHASAQALPPCPVGPVDPAGPPCVVAPPPTTTTTSTTTTTLNLDRYFPPVSDDKPQRGMFEGFGGERVGKFPDDHYDVGYDRGGWTDFGRAFWGNIMLLCFGLGRLISTIGNWLISFVYDQGFAQLLAEPAAKMASTYAGLPMVRQLRRFAILLVVVYAGFQLLRGRSGKGLTELLASAIFLILGLIFLANPGGYLVGAFSTVGQISQSVMTVGASSSGETPSMSARKQLHITLVEVPYDTINWSRSLTGACADQRDKILADGPHGISDKPREIMSEVEECKHLAEWNAVPTPERAGAAFMSLVVVGLVVGLLAAVALMVIVGQFTAAAIVAGGAFAAVGLLLPGRGRGIGVWALAKFGAGLAAVAGGSLLLAIGLGGLTAILELTETSILGRSLITISTAVAMWKIRKRTPAVGAGFAATALAAAIPAAAAGGVAGGMAGGYVGSKVGSKWASQRMMGAMDKAATQAGAVPKVVWGATKSTASGAKKVLSNSEASRDPAKQSGNGKVGGASSTKVTPQTNSAKSPRPTTSRQPPPKPRVKP